MAHTRRVFELAQELGITSKAILEKCKAEDVPDISNHMSTVKLGLAETIRLWFNEHSGDMDLGREADALHEQRTEEARYRAIGMAICGTSRLEKLLRDFYGAQGKGLYALTQSVRHKLDKALVAQIRIIAQIRNRLVHTDNETVEARKIEEALRLINAVTDSLSADSTRAGKGS